MSTLSSVFWAGFFTAWFALMLRIHAVYRERQRVLDAIHALNQHELNQLTTIGELCAYDVEWRYDRYEQVSYDQMLWTFWRPVRSFYPPVETWRKED